MGIVVIGAVFVDIKGYPLSTYIPGGRNAGRIEQVHGGVSRNVVEDIANVELRPTFVGLVDDTGMGQDVIDKLARHKVNTRFIQKKPDGMGSRVPIKQYLQKLPKWGRFGVTSVTPFLLLPVHPEGCTPAHRT